MHTRGSWPPTPSEDHLAARAQMGQGWGSCGRARGSLLPEVLLGALTTSFLKKREDKKAEEGGGRCRLSLQWTLQGEAGRRRPRGPLPHSQGQLHGPGQPVSTAVQHRGAGLLVSVSGTVLEVSVQLQRQVSRALSSLGVHRRCSRTLQGDPGKAVRDPHACPRSLPGAVRLGEPGG